MSIEAALITSYTILLIGTYGLFIYQTVLLKRIARNTSQLISN